MAIGATLMFLMFLGMKGVGVVPLLREDPEFTRTLGYVLAGVVVSILAVALLILKPRVPQRTPGQSVEQFWATRASADKARLVWFIHDGAAVLANVSYVLTGEIVAAVVAAITIALFWMNGPNAFAKP